MKMLYEAETPGIFYPTIRVYGGTQVRILYTATVQSHICQFHRSFITSLKERGDIVDVAARNNLNEKKGLCLDFADNVYEVPFSRSPFDIRSNMIAYLCIRKILKEHNYDAIICNTPVGGIVTRLASRKSRHKGSKVIYMAHGFHFFKGAPKINWLLYFPVEKLMARLTDVIITINLEDYDLACKSIHARKVEYLPGIGIDLNVFGNCKINREIKRKEIGIPDGYVWVLSVGELLPDKDHATVIKAIAEIPNVFYTIAGNGRLDKSLLELAKKVGVQERFKLLGYTRTIPELCAAADIFAFPSLFEGLPVALMEAMASDMKIVCTYARGNNDLIDEEGGIKVHIRDHQGFAEAIRRLSSNDCIDMRMHNKEKIKNFSKLLIINRFLEIIDNA